MRIPGTGLPSFSVPRNWYVARRNPRSFQEYDRALREVAQEFMLLGLWRGKFFEKAAFCRAA
jgi:hypothetical protein